jgi:hypothetical protein
MLYALYSVMKKGRGKNKGRRQGEKERQKRKGGMFVPRIALSVAVNQPRVSASFLMQGTLWKYEALKHRK